MQDSAGAKWQWGVIVGLALARAAWAASRAPIVSPDSQRYRNPADPWATMRFDLGQGPGQLLQLLHLLPLNTAIALQAFAAALIWGWACIVATRDLPRWAFGAAALFTLSPWWLVWDNRAITEALTLAGVALFAAGAVHWVKGDNANALPMLVGAALGLLTRPLTVPLIAVVLILAVIARRGTPRPVGAFVGVSFLVAFAIVQSVMFNRAPITYDWLPVHTTMEGVRAADRFVSRSHIDGYAALAEARQAPACLLDADVPRGIPGLDPLWSSTCPDTVAWLESGGVPWQTELTDNLVPTVREMVSGPWLLAAWAGDALGDPHWLALRGVARTWWWPAVHAMNAAMWALMIGAVVRLLWPGRRWAFRAVFTVALLGYAAALWMFDGLEMWRHVLPAIVGLVPAALAASGRRETEASGKVAPPRR